MQGKHAFAGNYYTSSSLKAALVAIGIALACLPQGAIAQQPASQEANQSTFIPAPGEIVATLRAQFRVTPTDALKIAQAVLTEANRYSMSPVLLLSVMAVESGFDPRAVSVVGARGLMQILPTAHPRSFADIRDLDDPATNVRIGSAILHDYLDAAGGNMDAALLRYSGGGKGYARRVALHMQRFNSHFSGDAKGFGKASLSVSADH